MEKELIKKQCLCGIKVMCQKMRHGPTPVPVCGRCKKYGLKYSRREQLNIDRKHDKTKFT